MYNPKSCDLIDTIEGVAMTLPDFEKFMTERLSLKVERVKPGPNVVWPRPEPRDDCWRVGLYYGEQTVIDTPAGFVTALRVGNCLSVAVYRYEEGIPREAIVRIDAEGGVLESPPIMPNTERGYAKRLAERLRDGLQAVGALPVEPMPAQDGESGGAVDQETENDLTTSTWHEVVDIPIPFETLDALTKEYLPGRVNGWVDIKRIDDTSGSVVYRMRQRELGDLGAVRLLNTGDKSRIQVKNIPFPPVRDPTPKESATIDGREWLRKLRSEMDELYRKRQEHQRRVVDAYLNRLMSDPVWIEAQGEATELMPTQDGDSGARQPRTKGNSPMSIETEQRVLIKRTKRTVEEVRETLEQCGNPMVVSHGRHSSLTGARRGHALLAIKPTGNTDPRERGLIIVEPDLETGGACVTFDIHSFPYRSLFWQTVTDLMLELGMTPMPAQDSESGPTLDDGLLAMAGEVASVYTSLLRDYPVRKLILDRLDKQAATHDEASGTGITIPAKSPPNVDREFIQPKARNTVIWLDSFVARGFPHGLIRADKIPKHTATEYRFYNDEDTHVGTVVVYGDGNMSVTGYDGSSSMGIEEADVQGVIKFLPTLPTAGTCGLWTHLEMYLLMKLPVQSIESGDLPEPTPTQDGESGARQPRMKGDSTMSIKATTQPTAFTQLTTSLSSSTPNTQIDSILIVTVTKVEAKAVLDVFSRAADAEWTRQAIGNKTYYNLGTHGGVPVFMVQSEPGTATPGGALLTVRQAIQDIHPQAVIMCGIAFGLHPDKQHLGDILVAKQIQCYELQKVDVQQGQIPRGDRTTSTERLLDRFRSGDLDWQGVPRHFGLVLSGEKLVNDPTFRNRLLATEPEAVGGEMEGVGLYAAARDAKVDWILVKAICDWADGKKNDNTHPLAASNAAQFVLHVLQLGGWGKTEQLPIKNEYTEIIKGKTLQDVRDVLKEHAYREQDKVILCGPFNEGGAVTALFKQMIINNKGKLLPDELHFGRIEATPDGDDVCIVFQRRKFPASLFQPTVNDLLLKLGVTPMLAQDGESGTGGELKISVADYDRAARDILENKRDKGIDYSRREIGEAVYYDIYRGGVEIGKWAIDVPYQGLGSEALLTAENIARKHGADVSYLHYGDMKHISEDELRRDAIFIDLTHLLRDRVAFVHDARKRVTLVQDAGSGAGDVDQSKLLDVLNTSFDSSELRTLCFHLERLGIDYDSLQGEGKQSKTRELIQYCKRHKCIPELVETIVKQRPEISWSDVTR